MTKAKMIDRIVDNDIADIEQALYDNDTELLDRILRGEGWISYNNMTKKEIEREYKSREFEDGDYRKCHLCDGIMEHKYCTNETCAEYIRENK